MAIDPANPRERFQITASSTLDDFIEKHSLEWERVEILCSYCAYRWHGTIPTTATYRRHLPCPQCNRSYGMVVSPEEN